MVRIDPDETVKSLAFLNRYAELGAGANPINRAAVVASNQMVADALTEQAARIVDLDEDVERLARVLAEASERLGITTLWEREEVALRLTAAPVGGQAEPSDTEWGVRHEMASGEHHITPVPDEATAREAAYKLSCEAVSRTVTPWAAAAVSGEQNG